MRENRTHGSMRRREAPNDQSAQSARPMKPPADPTYGRVRSSPPLRVGGGRRGAAGAGRACSGGSAAVAVAGRERRTGWLDRRRRRQSGGRIGEVSGAAEAHGVTRGMLLGEALARCPELVLVPADPVVVAEPWEGALGALEAIGAAVEEPGTARSAGSGLAYFEADGLRGLHGTRRGTRSRPPGARSAVPRAWERGRRASVRWRPRWRCARAGRSCWRAKDARRWLAGRPVGLLGYREETAVLLEPLDRLGVRTLGELTRAGAGRRSPTASARRGRSPTGSPAARTRPLRPRRVAGAPGGVAGGGRRELRRGAGARAGRAGRTACWHGPSGAGARCARSSLSAPLLAGGGWRERVVFRQALGGPRAHPAGAVGAPAAAPGARPRAGR